MIYIDALKSTTDLGRRMKFIAELDEPQLKRVVDALITGHETSDWDDFANLGWLHALRERRRGK